MTGRQISRTVFFDTMLLAALFAPALAASQIGAGTMKGYRFVFFYVLAAFVALLYGLLLIALAPSLVSLRYAASTRLLRIIDILYGIRYLVRGVALLWLLVVMVKTFLIRDMRVTAILLPASFTACYMATRTVNGRARMIDLLFWWLLVPFAGVFLLSLGRWDFDMLSVGRSGEWNGTAFVDILLRVLVCTMPVEHVVFYVKDKVDQTCARRGLVCGFFAHLAIFLLAFFTVGVTGLGHRHIMVVPRVFRCVKLPGNVLPRIDLLVIPILLLGLFVMLSGTIVYGLYAVKQAGISTKYPWLSGAIWVGILTAFVLALQHRTGAGLRAGFLRYLIWIDLPCSLLLPVLLSLGKTGKKSLLAFCVLFAVLLTGCNRTPLEKNDYVLMLGVDWEAKDSALENSNYEITVSMADMQGYKAETGEQVKMKHMSERTKSLKKMQEKYNLEHDTALDFGHASLLLVSDSLLKNEKQLKHFLEELEEENMITEAILLAGVKDSAKTLIEKDEEEEQVLSEALVAMLEKEGNLAVSLKEVETALEDGEPVSLPVLELKENASMPVIEEYTQLAE